MCPIKTENLALNFPREEAEFWRRLAFDLKARSRGDFQKLLLLVGLERVSPGRARELKEIRQRYYGLALALVLGLVGLQVGSLLTARRVRVRTVVASRVVRAPRGRGWEWRPEGGRRCG